MRKLVALFMVVLILLNLSACTITINPSPNTTTTAGEDTTTTTTEIIETSTTAKKPTTAKKVTTKKPTTAPKPATTTTNKPTTTTTKKPTTATPTTTAHVHNYQSTVVAPTCTAQGYTTYTCSCGHSYKDNYVEPRHTFVNHVCSVCKVNEYGKGYDRLASWLLKNGTTYAEYVYIGSSYNGNVDIRYYPQDDLLAFSSYYNYYGEVISLMLFLYRDGSSSYFNGPDGVNIYGLIDTDVYTRNYPLSYDECEVAYPYSTTYEFLEDTRQNINRLLDGSKITLSQNNIGVTLADLGFISYT